jgi:BirA family biotin operon repressor/biotin-[acetyl-CoA-carboxylase] ligase
MLTPEGLKNGLKTRRFARKIFTFDDIDSTNNCAKALAGCWAEEGTVVVAEYQSEGRGRLGRTWESNRNENLTLSIILRPSLQTAAINLLPLYVAVAVSSAVEAVTGLRVECKWPNDLLIGGRKFAGILLEGSVNQNELDYVVIGIGINVNQTTFPAAITNGATSLAQETGRQVDRTVLFREVMSALERHYDSLTANGFSGVLPLWTARATMINKPITVSQNGTAFSGVVKGISPDGGLVLQTGKTEQTLFAGDVTILKE